MPVIFQQYEYVLSHASAPNLSLLEDIVIVRKGKYISSSCRLLLILFAARDIVCILAIYHGRLETSKRLSLMVATLVRQKMGRVLSAEQSRMERWCWCVE